MPIFRIRKNDESFDPTQRGVEPVNGAWNGATEWRSTQSQPEPAPPLPTFQQDQPWQTTGINLLKNTGQGVQNFLGGLFKPGENEDPNSWQNQAKDKIGQGISFFPSTVSAAFGIPARESSPAASEAYKQNYKTLGGDTPGIFDFPAVARGYNAARETRADELRKIAENENPNTGSGAGDLLERGTAALGQGLYGAVPNFAPVGILPKGTVSAVTRGVSAGAEAVAPAARLAAARVARAIPEPVKAFNAGQGGEAQIPRSLLGKTPEQRAEIERLSRALQPEAPSTGFVNGAAAPARTPYHLDPTKVAPEVAQRNQVVHDLNLDLVGAVQRMQAGTAGAEEQVAGIISKLKAQGVSESNTIAKLKQSGIKGLPGTNATVSRASRAADVTPGAETNAGLAVARGVSPEAALKGTADAGSTAAVLRQKLSGAQKGPIVIPPKKDLAQIVAERAAAMKGAPIQGGMSDAQKTAARAAAKARLQFESGRSPDLTPAQIAEARAPLSLLTDEKVSTSDFLAQRARIQQEGTPVGNPAGTATRAAPPMPADKVLGNVGEIVPAKVRVPKPKPAVTSGNAVTNAPVAPAPTTGMNSLKVGTVIPGKGKIVQKGSATAGPAIRRPIAPVAAPPPPAANPAVLATAPKVTTPPPPTVAAAPAPSTRVTPPSQPLAAPTAGALTKGNSVTRAPLGAVGGTAATGGKTGAKRSAAPVQLNPTTFMYEAKTPAGLIVGTGATHNQAVKAAQAYHAANSSIPGGVVPPGGGGGGGGGGAGKIPGGGSAPKRPPMQGIASEVLNAERTVQTTGDLSYSIRQGFVLAAGHPLLAKTAFWNQMKAFKDHKFAADHASQMMNDPAFKQVQDLGLELTSWDQNLGPLEEGFLASRLAGLPIIKHSNIAGVTFLNDMRFGVAKQVLKGAPNATEEQLKATMRFLNAATGRGNFHKAIDPKLINSLNGIFYSPRFQLSRYEVATAVPYAALTRNPVLMKEAARDVVAATVAGKMLTQLATWNGSTVVADETSPDWGKIQVGNTRVDIWGGFQPIARIINQAIEGKRTTIGGDVIMLDQLSGMPQNQAKSGFSNLLDKYRPPSDAAEFLKKSIYGKFIRSKLAPTPGLGLDALLGQNYAGQPFDLGNELQRGFTPLGWQDIYEAVADDLANGGSGARGAAVGSLSLLGAGVQTIPANNQQYPPLPSAVAGAALGGLSLFRSSPSGFGGSSAPAASPTPKPTKSTTGKAPVFRVR
jgi:hypothetical protein